MQVEHEGAVYLCHQCDYQATEPRNPKKHEGVRYSCNQCEYRATGPVSLKRHQISKHEGLNVSDIPVTSASIRHHERIFSSFTKNPNMKVSDMPVNQFE